MWKQTTQTVTLQGTFFSAWQLIRTVLYMLSYFYCITLNIVLVHGLPCPIYRHYMAEIMPIWLNPSSIKQSIINTYLNWKRKGGVWGCTCQSVCRPSDLSTLSLESSHNWYCGSPERIDKPIAIQVTWSKVKVKLLVCGKNVRSISLDFFAETLPNLVQWMLVDCKWPHWCSGQRSRSNCCS